MLVNTFQGYVAYAYGSTLTEIIADGSVNPALATSWDSKDAITWHFKIRTDVEFHNGRKLTPADVVASFNYHRRPGSTSSVKPTADQFDTISVDGDDGIILRLKVANADLPASFNDPAFSVFPASGETIDWQAGIGSGAYLLEAFEPGSRALLKRNPNYWRNDRGFADEVEILSIPDSTARTGALISGQVQAIDEVELKTVELLRAQPGIVLEQTTGPLHYSFPMLTDVAPFDNIDVRRALKYAIDRNEIVDKLLFGFGTVGNDHPIGPSYPYHSTDIEQNTYDPDKVKFHLNKAGATGLTVDLHAADAAFGGAVDVALLYAAQAQKAGITLNVVREANDAYWDNVWLKKPFCAAYWGGYPVESQIFAMGYAPGAAWNDTKWFDPKFESLRLAASGELNTDKRREIYREMQTIMRDDGGSVIFAFPTTVMARNDQVAHGPLSSNNTFDGSRIVERWWVV